MSEISDSACRASACVERRLFLRSQEMVKSRYLTPAQVGKNRIDEGVSQTHPLAAEGHQQLARVSHHRGPHLASIPQPTNNQRVHTNIHQGIRAVLPAPPRPLTELDHAQRMASSKTVNRTLRQHGWPSINSWYPCHASPSRDSHQKRGAGGLRLTC